MSCSTLCSSPVAVLGWVNQTLPHRFCKLFEGRAFVYYFLLTCSLKQNQWSPLHVATSIAIHTTVISVLHLCFYRILCTINPCTSLVLLSCSDVTDKNHLGEVISTLLEPLRIEYYQSYTDYDRSLSVVMYFFESRSNSTLFWRLLGAFLNILLGVLLCINKSYLLR